MPRKTSCVYSQCIRQGSKRGCRTQKRCVTKTQVSLTLCKLQEIQKSDTCSWGQNIALTLGSSCSSTYELQCRPLLSLHPPPPTDLNIGVESAPLEGHMWPHSQLIRRVQFFFTLSAATCRVKTETANAALNCVVVVGWTCPTLNRWRRHVGIKCCGFMDWRTSCSAWRGNFVHNRSHTAHLALNTELGGKVLMFLTWRTHIGHLIHTSRSVQTDRVGSLSGNVWDTLRKVTRIRSAWFSLGLPANTWKIL